LSERIRKAQKRKTKASTQKTKAKDFLFSHHSETSRPEPPDPYPKRFYNHRLLLNYFISDTYIDVKNFEASPQGLYGVSD
jgi:hypothetical protein